MSWHPHLAINALRLADCTIVNGGQRAASGYSNPLSHVLIDISDDVFAVCLFPLRGGCDWVVTAGLFPAGRVPNAEVDRCRPDLACEDAGADTRGNGRGPGSEERPGG